MPDARRVGFDAPDRLPPVDSGALPGLPSVSTLTALRILQASTRRRGDSSVPRSGVTAAACAHAGRPDTVAAVDIWATRHGPPSGAVDACRAVPALSPSSSTSPIPSPTPSCSVRVPDTAGCPWQREESPRRFGQAPVRLRRAWSGGRRAPDRHRVVPASPRTGKVCHVRVLPCRAGLPIPGNRRKAEASLTSTTGRSYDDRTVDLSSARGRVRADVRRRARPPSDRDSGGGARSSRRQGRRTVFAAATSPVRRCDHPEGLVNGTAIPRSIAWTGRRRGHRY